MPAPPPESDVAIVTAETSRIFRVGDRFAPMFASARPATRPIRLE